MLIPPIWSLTLQQASFRGFPFETFGNSITRGRSVKVHQYPFRDDVYVEDLGRSVQEISFRGFLTGDFVYVQRDTFAKLCDTPGVGTLVHPSLGQQQASLISISFDETAENGRMVGFEAHFIISGPILFPNLYPLIGQNSFLKEVQGVLNTIGAAITDFVTKVQGFVATVQAAIAPFASLILGAAGIALAAISAVRGISLGQPNVNLGRYANGNLAAPTNSLNTTSQSTASALAAAQANALATACIARAAVVAASANTSALASTGDDAFPQSVSDLVEAARTAIVDPADQIQALIPLCSYTPPAALPSTSPIGLTIAATTAAVGSLVTRMALASLSNACGAYQPTSSTETTKIVDQLLPLYDDAITSAADNGDLNSYLELRNLKTVTISDLQARGSNLPELITVTSQSALPSLVWAYRLYGDSTRSDELIQRADPPNPCFFPLAFQALSA